MKRNIFKIIVIALILIITKEIFMMIYIDIKNKEEINSYYNNESSFNYESDMVINIPNINLQTIVRASGDDYENLKYGLVYYKNTNYKEEIIIFGHSGMGYGTYFNRLDELKLNDEVYLYKNKSIITYIVDKIYTVNEDKVDILDNNEKEVLLLITCQKYNKNERLVVRLKLKNAETLKK